MYRRAKTGKLMIEILLMVEYDTKDRVNDIKFLK